jgi:large subunit ribosomal protein L25
MSSPLEFNASPRQGAGRRYSTRLRAKGKIPANVYGRGEKPVSVEIDNREIVLLYQRTIGKNSLLTMKFEGKETTVMFKEVQREPVKGKFLHVDFYHVDQAHPIKLRIPVELVGTAKGVKELGGILGHTTRFVRVRCLPKDIPVNITIDVTDLGLDESILLENITPPAGVTFLDNKHTVLAHVSEVLEEKAPEAAAAGAEGAAGAPEVITEKKKEGEEGAAAPAAGAKAGDKGKAAPAAAAKPGAAPAAKPDAKKK